MTRDDIEALRGLARADQDQALLADPAALDWVIAVLERELAELRALREHTAAARPRLNLGAGNPRGRGHGP